MKLADFNAWVDDVKNHLQDSILIHNCIEVAYIKDLNPEVGAHCKYTIYHIIRFLNLIW